VEGKQKIPGKATNYTVEGKGVRTEDRAIIIIESRRYTTAGINQEDMGGLAYRIDHVGAAGMIVVIPLAVQDGARKIAEYEGNIEIVRLDADATTTDFMLEFLEKVVAGRSGNFGGTGTLTCMAEAVQPEPLRPASFRCIEICRFKSPGSAKNPQDFGRAADTGKSSPASGRDVAGENR